jgi:hypothetical protein
MDRKPLVPLAFLLFAGLLFVLREVVPSPQFPLLANLRQGGRVAPGQTGGPDVRAPAQAPMPKRYVDACRDEAARRMARPDWPRLDRDGREAALVQLLALCGADAEFWTMPEHRQRRTAREFAAHFLDGPAGQPASGRLVDK